LPHHANPVVERGRHLDIATGLRQRRDDVSLKLGQAPVAVVALFDA
jgi:hypothetical protein